MCVRVQGLNVSVLYAFKVVRSKLGRGSDMLHVISDLHLYQPLLLTLAYKAYFID